MSYVSPAIRKVMGEQKKFIQAKKVWKKCATELFQKKIASKNRTFILN
jgi:hypothetical protein